jgi:hypothetical protein
MARHNTPPLSPLSLVTSAVQALRDRRRQEDQGRVLSRRQGRLVSGPKHALGPGFRAETAHSVTRFLEATVATWQRGGGSRCATAGLGETGRSCGEVAGGRGESAGNPLCLMPAPARFKHAHFGAHRSCAPFPRVDTNIRPSARPPAAAAPATLPALRRPCAAVLKPGCRPAASPPVR